MKKEKMELGITLVALVVTIVVLLILAGITLTYVFGDNSVFKQASEAKEQTEMAKAREKLELVLSTAKVPKYSDPKYNENEYLDKMILDQISYSKIQGDVAIVDGFAFSLDRSIPWIGEYIGKEEDLVFPEVNIEEPEYAENYKTAKLKITAIEKENGISKIEVIQHGQVIETYEYTNRKDQITVEYIAKQNGIYTVKAYSKLVGTARTEVKELVMSVEFSPNGNEEYQKEHSTKITVKEDTDKVRNLKYQWSTSLTEPKVESFTDSCNNRATIIGKGYTGTYYLWILLETENGKTNICRSEGFNFDNEGPNIIEFTTEKYSETGIILKLIVQDAKSGIDTVKFYLNEDLKEANNSLNTCDLFEKSLTIDDLNTGKHECKVVVVDIAREFVGRVCYWCNKATNLDKICLFTYIQIPFRLCWHLGF